MDEEFVFQPVPLAFETTCLSNEYATATSINLAADVCTVRRIFLHVWKWITLMCLSKQWLFEIKMTTFMSQVELIRKFSDSSQLVFTLCTPFFPLFYLLVDQAVEILKQD